MLHSQRGRMRRAALTGILAPSLLLGAAGVMTFGSVPGASIPSANAESVLSSGPCTAFGGAVAPSTTDMSVPDVAEKVNPAVVTVLNLQPLSQASMGNFTGIDGFPDMPGSGEIPALPEAPGDGQDGGQQAVAQDEDPDTIVPVGSGSGFFADELGHVVTNAHVVDGATELKVVLQDGTELPATVIGADSFVDVAIIQVELPSGQPAPGIAAFGDSDALRPGESVVAIGNALGQFPNTVSEGTVNGTHRAFPAAGGLADYIQHDSEIWHGNSGGPLLNLRGEVIGINTAGISDSEMGTDLGSADMAFAVEGNTVCKAAAALLADGEIAWPYMGIQGQQTTDGQEVTDIVADGPSATSGLEVGDVITAFDGKDLDAQTTLADLLFQHEPGDTVNLTVERDGASQSFSVTLGERPADSQ
ncbi:MAG: trypsin-like peptidase domain-containing protein [Thermomicrobiales bacterium]